MTAATALLAHAGGSWDEILIMLGLPTVVFVVLYLKARREENDEPPQDPEPPER